MVPPPKKGALRPGSFFTPSHKTACYGRIVEPFFDNNIATYLVANLLRNRAVILPHNPAGADKSEGRGVGEDSGGGGERMSKMN